MVEGNTTVYEGTIWFRDGNFRVVYCDLEEGTVYEAVVDQAL